MKILILGGSGMLGHTLWRVAAQRFDAYATVRTPSEPSWLGGVLDPARTITGVEAARFESVKRAFDVARPDVVVNCIGIVKQLEAASDPVASITVNALFPHQLAALCRASGVRLIQISTDCVFSGRRGRYTEADLADPLDLYGRSKLLGEVAGAGCLTVRCSMIGPELRTAHGLLAWLLAQRTTVRGYRHAIFSGLTTPELSRVLCDIAERQPDLHGVWHVAAEPISKLDLLLLLREAYGLPLAIEPADEPRIDRSLDGRRFREATGWVAPGWAQMVGELAEMSRPGTGPA